MRFDESKAELVRRYLLGTISHQEAEKEAEISKRTFCRWIGLFSVSLYSELQAENNRIKAEYMDYVRTTMIA